MMSGLDKPAKKPVDDEGVKKPEKKMDEHEL